MNKKYFIDSRASVGMLTFKIIHRGFKVPYVYLWHDGYGQWIRISVKYGIYSDIIGKAILDALKQCVKIDGRIMKLPD